MLENDLEYLDKIIIIKKIEELYKKYYFGWLYPFTNENLKAAYSSIDFSEKKVLTVTSSGDHAINSFYNGAADVECFDSNPLAKYYVELKLAGIKSLSYEEFLLFFYNGKELKQKHYFDKNFYALKIRKYLKDDYLIFWDNFFNKYSIKTLKKSFLFTNDYLNIKNLIMANEYLNENNYYKTKEIIKTKEIKYYDYNINELNKINKKYEIIVLSNILDYYNNNNLLELNNSLKEISNDNSIILLTYLYQNYLKKSYIKKFETLKDFNYKCDFFESSYDLSTRKSIKMLFPKEDGIVLAKKTK